MSDSPAWLPDFINMNDFDGDWNQYLDAIYMRFCDDLVYQKVKFQNGQVAVRKMPETKGKGYGFWHCISEGNHENERIPDMERCRRIAWIRAIIENVNQTEDVDCWSNKRGREKCWLLWLREQYLVVLAERDGYYLLKTAYLTGKQKAKTLRRERDEYFKKKPTPP